MPLLEFKNLYARGPGATIHRLPVDFAVEAKALLEVSLEGSVG